MITTKQHKREVQVSVSKEGYASCREVLFSNWQVIAAEVFIFAFWVFMLLSLFGILSISPIVVIWSGFVGLVCLSLGVVIVEKVLGKFFTSDR